MLSGFTSTTSLRARIEEGSKKMTTRNFCDKSRKHLRKCHEDGRLVRFQMNWATASIFGWGRIVRIEPGKLLREHIAAHPRFFELVGCPGMSPRQYSTKYLGGDLNAPVDLYVFEFVTLGEEPDAETAM